jgi:hypothetical protein
MLWVLMVSQLAANAGRIDDACLDTAAAGPPSDYSESGQRSFLLNYFALATTFSPLHAPVPSKAGTGHAGVEIAGIPPLGCKRRLVLDYTKTEDTNKTPVAPRIRTHFAFPKIGKRVVPYAGLGYIPPVPLMGTQNVITSGEFGFGVPARGDGGWQWGGRYHFTLMRTIAEIATPFDDNAAAFDDFYVGSTMGFDAMAGFKFEKWTPYAAVGLTSVATFFHIGDSGVTPENEDAFLGAVTSLGAQWRAAEHWSFSGELYAAPMALLTGRVYLGYVF